MGNLDCLHWIVFKKVFLQNLFTNVNLCMRQGPHVWELIIFWTFPLFHSRAQTDRTNSSCISSSYLWYSLHSSGMRSFALSIFHVIHLLWVLHTVYCIYCVWISMLIYNIRDKKCFKSLKMFCAGVFSPKCYKGGKRGSSNLWRIALPSLPHYHLAHVPDSRVSSLIQ